MIRCFYIAGTGMITQRNKMDVIINNVTNMDTTGYKQDNLMTRSFSDLLLTRMNDPAIINQTREVGPLNTGIHVDEIYIDFTVGAPESTGIPSNLAITSEEGFFVVQTAEGIQYTRNGAFEVDVNGNLVTQDGGYVMGTGGPINVGTTENYSITTDGRVYVGDQQVNQLQIVDWEDRTVLRKTGDNNYLPFNGEAPTQVANPSVAQGYLESSNVEMARVMADLLMTNRVYEASQRMLSMSDESLGQTINLGAF